MSTTITDKAGLQAMKDTLDGDFVLGNAIDASGGDFTPVGDNSTPFTGTFDGGDYAITGLTIDHTGNYAGLFGYTNGATISNVTLSSPSVTASGDVVGALVGEADDTTISYITVTGAAIEVADDYAGGLVGIAEGTGITKCSFSGAVIGGDSCIGGLIGWLSGTAAISKCYVAASSTVNGGNYVGGFIGYNSGTGVTDCYTMADVVATNYYAGGFVGYQDANGIIVNSYSTGQPTAADTPGGFCADNNNTITNCFWDTETSGTEASDGGTGRTTAQMLFITTYTDWDFCFIWNINVALNDGYPFLRWTALDGGGETRTYTLPPIYDEKGRIPKGATARAYRSDTGALVETETLDSSGKATFTELPNDTDVSIHITWGGTTTTHKTEQIHSTIIGVTEGGTGASDEYNARSNLGLGSEDSPQFTAVNLGHATDTTIARVAAGRATIEGVGVVRGPASATDNIIPKFNLTTGDLIQQTGITADDSNNVSGVAKLTTTSDIELGNASDTTIHRESAGKVSVEGTVLTRSANYVVAASGTPTHVKAQADYVCDGTDDHVQILAAIDALPATGGKVLLTEGTFTNEAAIVLDSYQTLQGMGRNTILTTTTANLDIITATGGSGTEKVGILLADFCIDGNAGSAANDCGIIWAYVDYSKIRNVWSIDNGEYGAYIYYSDHNKIESCLFSNNGKDGLNSSTNDDTIILGNDCYSNSESGIYVYGNRVTAIGNTCNSNTESGIEINDTYDSTISGNTCVSNTLEGIYSVCIYNSVITQNTCNKNGTNGILGSFEECNLGFNSCSYNGEHGLNLTGMADAGIVGNTCIGNSQDTTNTYDDIFLVNVAECLISNNLCRAGDETNKPRYGINASNAGCANCKVINNDLYDDGFVTAPYSDSGTGTIYVEPGIDDTPVNGETGQPISSNWAFDHNAAALSSSVHPNTTLAKYYLGTDQNDIVANANSMVQLDTVVVDAGSNFQTGDWYGAAGAYRQADADSGANNIRDDDANFPAALHGALVKWASNAAGTTDTGVGYVTSVIAADDLYIVKTSGAAFAASYYYWIKKAYYVAPVTGYYPCFFQIQYKTGVEADKQYGVYAFVNGVYTIAALLHSSIASALRIPHNGVLSLTANDIVALYGFTSGTNATADIGSGEGNTVMSIFCLLEA